MHLKRLGRNPKWQKAAVENLVQFGNIRSAALKSEIERLKLMPGKARRIIGANNLYVADALLASDILAEELKSRNPDVWGKPLVQSEFQLAVCRLVRHHEAFRLGRISMRGVRSRCVADLEHFRIQMLKQGLQVGNSKAIATAFLQTMREIKEYRQKKQAEN